jgi:prepilin-type N-terminal cleavage/methylation domain-containing protein
MHGCGGVGGWTLVEVLTVMVIISVLAGIAMPRIQSVVLKAKAAEVVGDMNVIKVAVFNYQADNNDWPRDVGRGSTPGGLGEYLPSGFDFRKDDYTLDYDNWSGRIGSKFNVGITVITGSEELRLAVMEMLGSNIWSDGQSEVTWIIDSEELPDQRRGEVAPVRTGSLPFDGARWLGRDVQNHGGNVL